MARAFLINTVRGTFGTILAGTEVDDQSRVAAQILAAGGQLVEATNTDVADAAARVLRLRRRGGSDAEANRIMTAALDVSQENRVENAALSQATWFVDPVNGDDENIGDDAAEPLATIGEYIRRIGRGTPTVAATMTCAPGTYDEGSYNFQGDYSPVNALSVFGTRTVLGTGTFDSVQLWDETPIPALPGVEGQLGASGLADEWTALGYLEKMFVMTGGAQAGATGWVMKDLGTKTIRYSPMTNFLTPGVDPTADTFEVVDLPVIKGPVLCNHKGTIFFRNLDFEGDDAGFFEGIQQNSGSILALECAVRGHSSKLQGAAIVGQFQGCLMKTEASTFQVENGIAFILACAVLSTIRTSTQRGTIELGSDVACQDASITCKFGGDVLQDSGTWAAFLDNTLANRPGWECGAFGVVQLRGVSFGLNWDNGIGVWVDTGGQVLFKNTENFADVVNIDGVAIDEVKVGEAVNTYAFVSTTGLITTARRAGIMPYENTF